MTGWDLGAYERWLATTFHPTINPGRQQPAAPGAFTGRRGRPRVFGGGQYLASSLNILPGSAEWQAGRAYLRLGARRTSRPEARAGRRPGPWGGRRPSQASTR
jgi:hypothetical protein